MPLENCAFAYPSTADYWRPYLPIEIVNPDNESGKTDLAAIDTGSKRSLVPIEYADFIGLELTNDDHYAISSIGKFRDAYKKTVTFRVFPVLSPVTDKTIDTDKIFVQNNISVSISLEIGFVPELKYCLLGHDFLQKYVFTVNYSSLLFSVRNPDNKRTCPVCKQDPNSVSNPEQLKLSPSSTGRFRILSIGPIRKIYNYFNVRK